MSAAVPGYLVERYLPGLSAEEVHAAVQRLRTTTEQMTAAGTPVDYLSSAYVPEEDSCFCQLEAPSHEAVATANERAAFPFARILAVDGPTLPSATLWPRFGAPLDHRRPIGVMHTESHKAPVASGSAAVTRLAHTGTGITVAATGRCEEGIGRVDFVLIDLAGSAPENVVDRKDVEYAKPPTQVAEAWDLWVALSDGAHYRLFFHVYDPTGVGLVAYDRRDFSPEHDEGG